MFFLVYEVRRSFFDTHVLKKAPTRCLTMLELKTWREKNWNIAVGRGFVNSSFFRIRVSFSPRKIAKFSLNFWPVRVHEKPSFRYVASTFFAKRNPRHASVLRMRVSTCACPFKTRVFAYLRSQPLPWSQRHAHDPDRMSPGAENWGSLIERRR